MTGNRIRDSKKKSVFSGKSKRRKIQHGKSGELLWKKTTG